MNQFNGIYMKSPNGTIVRLECKEINKKLKLAQYWLDTQVMHDMIPLMPHVKGTFIQDTVSRSQALAGTGVVCAGAPPMGRYLYMGKVMVDSRTGKGARRIVLKTGEVIYRHRQGAILVPTDRPLHYSRSTAVSHWYEVAKERHFDQWLEGVKKILES